MSIYGCHYTPGYRFSRYATKCVHKLNLSYDRHLWTITFSTVVCVSRCCSMSTTPWYFLFTGVRPGLETETRRSKKQPRRATFGSWNFLTDPESVVTVLEETPKQPSERVLKIPQIDEEVNQANLDPSVAEELKKSVFSVRCSLAVPVPGRSVLRIA